jgi:hypothetical protein
MGRTGMHVGYLLEVQKQKETTRRRPRRKWVEIIRMELEGIECGGVYWIDLGQDRE